MVSAQVDERTGEERKRRHVTVIRAEQWWRDQARLNPVRFIHYLTGKEPAKHHKMWIANIFDFDPLHKKFRLNFIAPRESGKTTIVTYCLAWFIARYPHLTNAIVSVSAKQSRQRLQMIREAIEFDVRFKNVFPHIEIDEQQRNTLDQFSVRANGLFDAKTGKIKPIPYNVWRSIVKRHGSPKDPTMYATGVGGKGIIGSRINGILIFDDIIDDSTLSEQLQQDTEDYVMRTLEPIVQEQGKIVNIGTRWMMNDLPERFMNNPAWHTIEIRAIEHDEEGEPHSYWPGFWPLEKLEQKRINMNNDTLFKLMYLNDPTALASGKFTVAGLSKDLPSPLPPLKSIIIGTDLAAAIKQISDWTAFTAIGLDSENNFYILDQRRMKATPDIVVKQIADFANVVSTQYGRLDKIIIENVAFQSTMKFSIVDKFPHLPVEPFTPIGDKGHRAEALAMIGNSGTLFINKGTPAYKIFLAECMDFPLRGHDDLLDSATLAIQYISKTVISSSVKTIYSPFLI